MAIRNAFSIESNKRTRYVRVFYGSASECDDARTCVHLCTNAQNMCDKYGQRWHRLTVAHAIHLTLRFVHCLLVRVTPATLISFNDEQKLFVRRESMHSMRWVPVGVSSIRRRKKKIVGKKLTIFDSNSLSLSAIDINKRNGPLDYLLYCYYTHTWIAARHMNAQWVPVWRPFVCVASIKAASREE